MIPELRPDFHRDFDDPFDDPFDDGFDGGFEPNVDRRPLPLPGRPRDAGGGLRFPPGVVRADSGPMRALYREMAAVAASELPVLLSGETGVGKEHLARTLHDSSERRRGPWVPVNCAALPADLLEAEMFGIGDGVASGVRRREGCFREARGGTLFLDEVGEMAPALQAKLLRALQEREVRPVGGRPVPVDVRIVAATNVDLDRQLEEGRLRTDLYYRLAGVHLRVPPLRERPADVPALARRFLESAAADLGRPAPGCTGEALSALAAYPWPGNVRELEHQVRRLVHLAGGRGAIGVELLPSAIRGAAEGSVNAAAVASNDTSNDTPADAESPADGSLRLDERLAGLERRLIREALRRAGSISGAARLLGVSRNGLKMKARRHGVELRCAAP